ncbi:MAG: hypothetical protein J5781_00830, partial [Clostridia bacterium]|nr:hypothetical protein [Clostridia bacterium]
MLNTLLKSVFSVYGAMALIILLIPFFLKGKKNKKLWFVIISCAIMFFVMGFRDCYSVGNDSSSSYLHQFQNLTN